MRPTSSFPADRSLGLPVRASNRAGRRRAPVARRAALAAATAMLVLPAGAHAAAVDLGSADAFGVLGGASVTNTGPSVIGGDVGTSPGTSITGFPPGVSLGTIRRNDAVAGRARADLITAYGVAASRPSTAPVAADLAGRTLRTGVYTSASSMGLTGDLTLDGGGDPNATFVFQAGTTLTVGAGSRVLFINGAQACNVAWQVGTSATVGANAAFAGDVLALTSITAGNGTTVDGRALAQNGTVSLDTNTVTRATCTVPPSGGGTPSSGGTPSGGGTPSSGGSTTTPTSGAGSGSSTPLRVSTGTASGGTTKATLRGTVRPGPTAVRYYIEYGTTDRYGRRTSEGTAPAGSSTTTVRRNVRKLRTGTRYHYRLVVVRPGGRKTFGRDRIVRTRVVTPRAATPGSPTPGSPARTPRAPFGLTG